ncbi:Mss4-like protein [Mycena rebaudengoi]|nr:Mss4-like protein [Mycena rebaudengoi]
MSETPLVDYPGNCHCGAFKFILKVPKLEKVLLCNCSICSRNGYLWVFPARPEDLVVIKGDENTTLKGYDFGSRGMTHRFCPTCGTSVLARVHARQSIGVNVRALTDADAFALEEDTFDGAALKPAYEAPTPLAVDPVDKDMQVYTGNCHCGAVKYAVQKDSPVTSALECNCSICYRDAALWIYPLKKLVTVQDTTNALVGYTFAKKTVEHQFCGNCGVALFERYQPRFRTLAINVRTMNDLVLAEVQIEKEDGKKDLPLYEVQ